MSKLINTIFTLNFSLLLVICNGQSLLQDSKTLILPIRFRVYLHELISGPNATVYEVARASISTTPTSFGIVRAADSFMTVGPDPNSQNLGRAQGHSVTTGLYDVNNDKVPVSLTFNFVFTAGEYKGSSLTIVGRKLLLGENQDIPIVGGTGRFRLARGYSISNLYSYNSTTDTYIIIYDFYVV